MTSTTKAWVYGLGNAFIGAFATAASGAMALPTVFNFSHDGIMNILKLTMAPALVAVFSYLQRSPLPPPSVLGPGDTATVKNPVIAQDGSITGDSATLQKALATTVVPPASK